MLAFISVCVYFIFIIAEAGIQSGNSIMNYTDIFTSKFP